MLKEQALEVISQVARQHANADYILGEVHSYFMNNNYIDKDFRRWFIRQWEKYQKGDK